MRGKVLNYVMTSAVSNIVVVKMRVSVMDIVMASGVDLGNTGRPT